jgi:hypothetical protein
MAQDYTLISLRKKLKSMRNEKQTITNVQDKLKFYGYYKAIEEINQWINEKQNK